MKLLFICNQNKNRSKTAETMYKKRYLTKSAGLYNERPVTKEQIAWADTIIVMENEQRKEISKRFPAQYMQKKILTLNIPDVYKNGQPELVKEISEKMRGLL